mgnify:CR=1 FL=1
MTTVSASLDIRNFAATPGDGYTNTTASNGATYCYKYSGGTDGNGGVEVTTGTGTLTLTVTVGSDPRYTVYNVTFTGDTAGDMSWTWGNIPLNNQAIIADTDTSNEDAYYSVIIQDRTAQCTFACDPPLKNKPPVT